MQYACGKTHYTACFVTQQNILDKPLNLQLSKLPSFNSDIFAGVQNYPVLPGIPLNGIYPDMIRCSLFWGVIARKIEAQPVHSLALVTQTRYCLMCVLRTDLFKPYLFFITNKIAC